MPKCLKTLCSSGVGNVAPSCTLTFCPSLITPDLSACSDSDIPFLMAKARIDRLKIALNDIKS